jgi:DNA mismatch endonuclease, patch repair protein
LPEKNLRKALFARGYRYRLHAKNLPGRPDFIFPGAKVAVFVNGCFWHRHPGCRATTTPRTNAEFWQQKFDQNISRDARNYEALRELGWHPLVVWECEVKRDLPSAVSKIVEYLPAR